MGRQSRIARPDETNYTTSQTNRLIVLVRKPQPRGPFAEDASTAVPCSSLPSRIGHAAGGMLAVHRLLDARHDAFDELHAVFGLGLGIGTLLSDAGGTAGAAGASAVQDARLTAREAAPLDRTAERALPMPAKGPDGLLQRLDACPGNCVSAEAHRPAQS